MTALHAFPASFVATQALNNQVATVQVVGSADERLGPINRLMLAFLDTAILLIQVDASVPIQPREVSVSQGSSALKGHVSQYRAQEVRTNYARKYDTIQT